MMDKPLEATLNLSALTKKNWIISERISREEVAIERSFTLT